MTYVLVAFENIHHQTERLLFESDVPLRDLFLDEQFRDFLDRKGLQDNITEEWEHRLNDYGFEEVQISSSPAIYSRSDYGYSNQIMVQEYVDDLRSDLLELALFRKVY
jgi:hypothetical protein